MNKNTHKQCFNFDADLENIKLCVKEDHRVLVLLRGASGSGKTHLATEMQSWTTNCEVYRSESAQEVLMKDVRKSIDNDTHLIIVDTNNTDRAMITKFAKAAIRDQYECFVLEPNTTWRYNPEECARRSSRGATVDSIAEAIQEILDTSIEWKHLVGDKEVEIESFHFDDYPVFSYPPKVNGSSLLSESSSSSTSSLSVTPLFSMKPPEKVKVTRDVSTQVECHNIARVLADIDDKHPSSCTPETEVISTVVWKEPVRMIDRAEQASSPNASTPTPNLIQGTTEDVCFSMLRATFWQTDVITLRHQLQCLGYKAAYKLFLSLKEPTADFVYSADDTILAEEVSNEECQIISTITIEEEVVNRRLERMRARRLVEESTASDELLARHLHEEINQDPNQRAPFEAQDRENLGLLQRMFPQTKPEMIRTIFEEIAFKDFDLTVQCLHDGNQFFDPHHEKIPKKKTWSSTVSAHSPGPSLSEQQKTESEKKNHFLRSSPRRLNLETVQREALEERRRLEAGRVHNVNTADRTNHSNNRNLVLMERAKRLREHTGVSVRNIDQRLKLAHHDPYQLDLHYMSVEAAKALVVDAVEAVKYKKRIDGRTRNRITVVTGSGNNSRNGAKIKPEVANMLNSMRISFNQLNDGCILVKV